MNIRYPIYEGVYRILTLQDRRQIIVQGERCPGIAGNQPDGSVRLNPHHVCLPDGFSFPWQTAIHIVFQFLPAKVAFCLRLGKAVLRTGWKEKIILASLRYFFLPSLAQSRQKANRGI